MKLQAPPIQHRNAQRQGLAPVASWTCRQYSLRWTITAVIAAAAQHGSSKCLTTTCCHDYRHAQLKNMAKLQAFPTVQIPAHDFSNCCNRHGIAGHRQMMWMVLITCLGHTSSVAALSSFSVSVACIECAGCQSFSADSCTIQQSSRRGHGCLGQEGGIAAESCKSSPSRAACCSQGCAQARQCHSSMCMECSSCRQLCTALSASFCRFQGTCSTCGFVTRLLKLPSAAANAARLTSACTGTCVLMSWQQLGSIMHRPAIP